MTFRSILIRLSVVAILLFQAGCVSQQKLTHADLPEDISLDELRKEMRSTNRSLYGLGGAVLTGALGLISGGYIGYKIDRQVYCNEDCGLSGLVYGGMVGLGAGLILGSAHFSRSGAKKDRREAIERIRRRRTAEDGGSLWQVQTPSLMLSQAPSLLLNIPSIL